MTSIKPIPDPYHVALITVCVGSDTQVQIGNEMSRMPWAVASSHWDHYLTAARRVQFPTNIANADACVAVVDFDKEPAQAIESVDLINQAFLGRAAIVALSSQSDPELLLRAMRAGCNEFLRKPFHASQFGACLANQDNKWSHAASRAQSSGQVLSFFGAKGGVGTTTIAIHLAISLVRLHGKKVLLVDNHPQFGHVCLYLGLEGAHYHFHEVVRNVDRLDSELLRGFVAHHPVGMDVLASPDTFNAVRPIDPDALVRTVEYLRGQYDYILLDCVDSFDENSLTVIDASDRFYLIATPDLGAVRNLSRYVDSLMRNEERSAKAQIVINRYSSQGAVDIRQIENALRLPVVIKLPNSYAELVRALNVGEPLSTKKKSEISTQFLRWANEIAGVRPVEAPRSSLARLALW